MRDYGLKTWFETLKVPLPDADPIVDHHAHI